MLTQHIALVPVAGGVDASELARVAAALQKQVTRDLAPLWGISATVDAFPELEDVPLGYWPILLSTGESSQEIGRFDDENGQPYAQVLLSPHWSVVASRICLEMLVNPFGNRSVVCASPRYDQGLVQMLVEICAACEDPSHAYVINDVLVSDFCTPGFYESDAVSAQERCSFYGSLAAPLQLLIGGHLTWFDSASESWWLRTQHDAEPVDTRLGSLDAEIGSVRELVRRYAPPVRRTWTLSYEAFETRARLIRDQAVLAAHARARRLRALIGQQVDASEAFEEVTREFDLSDVSSPVPGQADAAARLPAHEEQRHEPVSEDEPPLELAAFAVRRAEPPLPALTRATRVTEGSVVASFVLPAPDPPAPAADAAAKQASAQAALIPARPEDALAAMRAASVDVRAAAREPGVAARARPAPPPSSSIAPPTLALMAPERSREGVDARLNAGALVIALLAVLAFTQRRARSTPSAARPAAIQQAAPAPVGDAKAASTPPATGAPAAVGDAKVAPTASATGASAAAPAPNAAPAAVAAQVAPPSEPPAASEPTRRARRSKPARNPKQMPIEELFDTRR